MMMMMIMMMMMMTVRLALSLWPALVYLYMRDQWYLGEEGPPTGKAINWPRSKTYRKRGR